MSSEAPVQLNTWCEEVSDYFIPDKSKQDKIHVIPILQVPEGISVDALAQLEVHRYSNGHVKECYIPLVLDDTAIEVYFARMRVDDSQVELDLPLYPLFNKEELVEWLIIEEYAHAGLVLKYRYFKRLIQALDDSFTEPNNEILEHDRWPIEILVSRMVCFYYMYKARNNNDFERVTFLENLLQQSFDSGRAIQPARISD